MGAARLAVIGAGVIGARHARLVAAEPACELVAIADPDPAVADLATEIGVAYYGDYACMLDAVRPEGAVVAVPTGLHAPIGIACAAKGVHLLMEKPIAETLASGGRLCKAVEHAGVRMAVGHHRRFDPAVEAARNIVRSGEIGRLIAVSVTWAVRKPDDYFEPEWRRKPGGGPVLINLIHDIDSLRYICGDIESVYAEIGRAARGFEVEDAAAILIRFACGALGTVTASDAAPSPWGWEAATGENPDVATSGENCYRFLGTDGSLDFPHLELWRHDGTGPGSWEHPLRRDSRPLAERAALAAQLRHFCRVVAQGEAPRVDGADGLATLAAAVAVLESGRRCIPVVPPAAR